jgi:micrococcal nuclease
MIAWWTIFVALAASPTGPIPSSGTVASVYDGDTLTLASGDKIRLKWVNTPELKPPEELGTEARDHTRGLVLGKAVTLLLQGEGERDGYGRVLAGIDVGGTNLSLTVVEQGLGHVFFIPPDPTDLTALVAAQDKARAARKGIWATSRYQGALHISSFHADAKGDDRQNVNGEYLRVCNVSASPVDLAAYTLKDGDKAYPLPAVTVPVGHTVKIMSGTGVTQADPTKQLEVFLGSADPVWNNDGSTAQLVDAKGAIVDQASHTKDDK